MSSKMLKNQLNPKGKMFKSNELSDKEYLAGVLNGDVSILGRAITLIESSNIKHQKKAEQLIESCLPKSGKSFRLGITGTPGVGKSTFIESFGSLLYDKGLKIAILAIDPSSNKNKGSILGDKTRMEQLGKLSNVFIRPSPSANVLGGVARKTRETIVLCEAAGYDFIIVETVGVGQSETMVKSLVDMFLLLLQPGAGDELQGIKRGIVEMADLIVINKADGNMKSPANKTILEYKNALHLFPPTTNNWDVPVLSCSSIEKTGLPEIEEAITRFRNTMKSSGFFVQNRKKQNENWLNQNLFDRLKSEFLNTAGIPEKLVQLKEEVASGNISPFKAAKILIDRFKKS